MLIQFPVRASPTCSCFCLLHHLLHFHHCYLEQVRDSSLLVLLILRLRGAQSFHTYLGLVFYSISHQEYHLAVVQLHIIKKIRGRGKICSDELTTFYIIVTINVGGFCQYSLTMDYIIN